MICTAENPDRIPATRHNGRTGNPAAHAVIRLYIQALEKGDRTLGRSILSNLTAIKPVDVRGGSRRKYKEP
jgi:hypothetical protein